MISDRKGPRGRDINNCNDYQMFPGNKHWNFEGHDTAVTTKRDEVKWTGGKVGDPL